MSQSVILRNDRCQIEVDPKDGARVTSFLVDGFELLRDEKYNLDGSIFGYGSFPMAPFAGRIRHGKFIFDNQSYQLSDLADPPHALHGTVIFQEWQIVESNESSCQLRTTIDKGWPFPGELIQRIELHPNHLEMVMKLTASVAMPAWIGFHPWFRNNIQNETLELKANFSKMYVRDAEKVATKTIAEPKPLPWDDCFIGDEPNIELRWGNLVQLKLKSNYPYWVIYSAPEDALCVEPQTGPPNAIELEQHQTLAPGESVELRFRISF